MTGRRFPVGRGYRALRVCAPSSTPGLRPAYGLTRDGLRYVLDLDQPTRRDVGLPLRDASRAEESNESPRATASIAHGPPRAHAAWDAHEARAGRRPMIVRQRTRPDFVVAHRGAEGGLGQQASWRSTAGSSGGVAALRLDHRAGRDLDRRRAARGPWLLSIDHPGVAAELAWRRRPRPLPGPRPRHLRLRPP